MKSKKMEQYLSEILTAIVSISVSYGVIKTKIRTIEDKMERFDRDHDLLVRIDEKINGIIENQKKLEEQQIKTKKSK